MTRRAVPHASDTPAALTVTLDGEIVPYTRVGRERWTPRARRYLGWRDGAAARMLAARVAAGIPPFDGGALAVDIAVHRYSQRGDIDNAAKAVLDAGNGVLWADDSQVTALTLCLVPCERGADRAVILVRPDTEYAAELRDAQRKTRRR